MATRLAQRPVTFNGADRFQLRSAKLTEVTRATVRTTPSENTSKKGSNAGEIMLSVVVVVARARRLSVTLGGCPFYLRRSIKPTRSGRPLDEPGLSRGLLLRLLQLLLESKR